MPIAFDPPAHAPHGNLHARPVRAQEDDDASLDVFTQLLLAAANVQDPAAPGEAGARPGKDDATAAPDAPLLALPLPPTGGATAPASNVVTIVASDGPLDPRVRAAAAGARRAADARTPGQGPVATVPPSLPGSAEAATATAAATAASAPSPDTATHADPHRALQALPSPSSSPAPSADAGAPGAGKPHGAPATAVSALAALLAAPIVPVPDKSAGPKSAQDAVAPTPQPTPAAGAAPNVAPATMVETVAAPAFTPGWQDETAAKLAQIVLTRNERAELRLNPAELGPVHVRVEMRAEQASVQIVAASPETRSALEQSLPQLRDLLAAQGITLGQASVHDGAAQRDARPDVWTASRLPSSEGSAPATDTVHVVVRQPNRLVDVFA